MILVFNKTPVPADQKGKTVLVKKLADKYKLSSLDYSKCLEDDNTGPDNNG